MKLWPPKNALFVSSIVDLRSLDPLSANLRLVLHHAATPLPTMCFAKKYTAIAL